MEYIRWLIIVVLSTTLGTLIVLYLTVKARAIAIVAIGMAAVVAAQATTFIFLFRAADLVVALILTGAFEAVGYLLTAKLMMKRPDPRPVPVLTRGKGDPGKGNTAVVYFTHGEPESYNPIGWINQFNEFDDQGIRFIPLVARPLFFHALRRKYLVSGGSGHRAMHQRMISALEKSFRDEGDEETRFYLSFLDDNPRPDAAAIQALNDGAGAIIVSEVFLTISNHTAEGEEQIEKLNIPQTFGVPVTYTGPLHDSSLLKRMFVERANEALEGTDKTKAGILLVGHGQPDEWDREWPTETEQEVSFRSDVMALLAEEGFLPQNIGLAWMEFKHPRPAAKIAEFIGNGIEKLLYFSSSISAEAIHSQNDVPELIAAAGLPESFPAINLGAWNDHPLVIAAIKEKIEDTVRRVIRA